MNNQLVAARPVQPGTLDVWQQSQSNNGMGLGYNMPAAPPPPAQPAIMAKVYRLLRGKIWLAAILGIICGIIGAIFGFKSQTPTYTAGATLEIKPMISRTLRPDSMVPFYNSFMATEASKLAGDSQLIGAAVQDPAYVAAKEEYLSKRWGVEKSKLKDAAFVEAKRKEDPASHPPILPNLKAGFPKNTYNLRVTYEHEDRELAEATLSAIVRAYEKRYKEANSGNNSRQEKLAKLDDRADLFRAQVHADEEAIRGEAGQWQTVDLADRHRNAGSTELKLQDELRVAEQELSAATSAVEAMQKNNLQLSISELAEVDAVLAKLVSGRNDLKTSMDSLSMKFLPNSPTMVEARRVLAIADQNIKDRVAELRERILGIIPNVNGSGYIIITPSYLRPLTARVDSLRRDLSRVSAEYAKLGAARMRIEKYQANIKKSQDDLQRTLQNIDALVTDSATSGELTVQNDGNNTAVMSTDKSKMMAVAGGLGGAAVPVGLLLLVGLMFDTRYKYSDDATNNMAGVPLLGILPNLPDRLSDPAQASIAAHCVHQIRTMLQLNAMREDSTAFAVTSAASGDGKTSLCLALGLSFAASGSRTLLIDADLIGGGLSSRLGVNSSSGIVEALAGQPVTEIAQATDVADLSLLPVGLAQAHHAGGFSPPAVRRLIAEAKKLYEVVIIDTGPVMGSIEATPICASVDGVVLTVARGQSRPLVERAISHMGSVGAKLAGVVFNRAQHKDFEQSIGAISIRSAARSAAASNGAGHNGRDATGHIGPVARAVATSVRGENN